MTVSDETGRFVFAQVAPGTYTITVELAGFKKFEQKGVVLSANDRLALADLIMELSAPSETVEVTAAPSALKTESAERSEALVAKQVENIAINGRNPLALISLVARRRQHQRLQAGRHARPGRHFCQRRLESVEPDDRQRGH